MFYSNRTLYFFAILVTYLFKEINFESNYIPWTCGWLCWLEEFSCCVSLLVARRGTLSDSFFINGQPGFAALCLAMTWSPYSHSLRTVPHQRHLTSESIPVWKNPALAIFRASTLSLCGQDVKVDNLWASDLIVDSSLLWFPFPLWTWNSLLDAGGMFEISCVPIASTSTKPANKWIRST